MALSRNLFGTVRGRVGRSPHGSVLKGLQGKLSSHLHSCQVPAGEKKKNITKQRLQLQLLFKKMLSSPLSTNTKHVFKVLNSPGDRALYSTTVVLLFKTSPLVFSNLKEIHKPFKQR